MKRLTITALTVVLIGLSLIAAHALEKQVVAGAGPSTKIVQLFIKDFSGLPASKGVAFEVPVKSAKHAGGIKCSDYNTFGRTGRPLNAEEKQKNKGEIFLAKVPIAFVVGDETGISSLTLEQLEKIFTRQVTNWKEVGGADKDILLAGRERTEALFLELKKDYDFFKNIEFDVVMNKDNHVVSFLKSPKGGNAIAFGAKPNFLTLNMVEVPDFTAGVRLGLVYDLSNSENPLVTSASSFAKSPAWQERVKQAGLIPIY